MADVVKVIVIDEGLYVGNGLVNRWLKGIGYSMYGHVFERAPTWSGQLKAGIRLDFGRDGLRILNAVVESTAPHTQYVIGGTVGNGVGYIYSHRGFANRATVGRMLSGEFVKDPPVGLWLILSDARGGRHLRVHGQRANNFLAKGYNDTAKTHRALRPIHRGLFGA